MDNRYKLSRPYDISTYLIKSIFARDKKNFSGWEIDLKKELQKISLTRLEGDPLNIQEIDYVDLERPVKDPDYNKESFYIETFGKDDNVDDNQDALIVFAIDANNGKVYAVDVDTEIFG